MPECTGLCFVKLSRIKSVESDDVGSRDVKITDPKAERPTTKEQKDAVDGAVGKVKQTPKSGGCPKPDKGKNPCDCTVIFTHWEGVTKRKTVHVPFTKNGNEFDLTCKGQVEFGAGLGYCDDGGDDYYSGAVAFLPALNLTLSLDTEHGQTIPGEAVEELSSILLKRQTPRS